MSSPQLHIPSIHVRPIPAFRNRRIAIAATVAIGLGAGAAAIVPNTSRAPQTISQSPSSTLPTPVPHVRATSASFVRRVHLLEARGYVQIACKTDGDLMFNPRTRSYATVRSESRSARVLSVGETSQSFVHRIRMLEARGYVEVACQVGGDRMFNPRTHRSETVQA